MPTKQLQIYWKNYNKVITFFGIGLAIMGIFSMFFFPVNRDKFRNKLVKPDSECFPQIGEIVKPQIGLLKTNIEKGIINIIDDTQSAKVEKNQIPYLLNPNFLDKSVDLKNCYQTSESFIVITINNTKRAYPLSILRSHQVINDQIDDKKFIVTFSPFSNDYNAFLTNDTYGVSGRIFAGNNLIFDSTTESLWLELTGTAVVGDKTGEKLEPLSFEIITYNDLISQQNIQVESLSTGYDFDYQVDPYKLYRSSEGIYGVNEQELDASSKEMVVFDISKARIIVDDAEETDKTTNVYYYTAQKISETLNK